MKRKLSTVPLVSAAVLSGLFLYGGNVQADTTNSTTDTSSVTATANKPTSTAPVALTDSKSSSSNTSVAASSSSASTEASASGSAKTDDSSNQTVSDKLSNATAKAQESSEKLSDKSKELSDNAKADSEKVTKAVDDASKAIKDKTDEFNDAADNVNKGLDKVDELGKDIDKDYGKTEHAASQEEINNKILEKYDKLVNDGEKDGNWDYGFPDEDKQANSKSSNEARIVIREPSHDYSPLENNTISKDGKTSTYTYDSASTSFNGFVGLDNDLWPEHKNKAYPLAPDVSFSNYESKNVENTIIVKHSYELGTTYTNGGYMPVVSKGENTGNISSEFHDKDSHGADGSVSIDLDVDEYAIATSEGNVVHKITFKNKNWDETAMLPHRYFTLIDTAFNGNDAATLKSDGKGGIYIADHNLVYGIRALGDSTLYAVDYSKAKQYTEDNMSTDTPVPSGKGDILSKVDTAVRIVSPEVTLAPGESKSIWYIETVNQLTDKAVSDDDLAKEINKKLDSSVSDWLKNLDDAQKAADDAQKTADQILNPIDNVVDTISKWTDVGKVVDKAKDAVDGAKGEYEQSKGTYQEWKDGMEALKKDGKLTDKELAAYNKITEQVEKSGENVDEAFKKIHSQLGVFSDAAKGTTKAGEAVEKAATESKSGESAVKTTSKAGSVIGKITGIISAVSDVHKIAEDLRNATDNIKSTVQTVISTAKEVIDKAKTTTTNLAKTAKNAVNTINHAWKTAKSTHQLDQKVQAGTLSKEQIAQGTAKYAQKRINEVGKQKANQALEETQSKLNAGLKSMLPTGVYNAVQKVQTGTITVDDVQNGLASFSKAPSVQTIVGAVTNEAKSTVHASANEDKKATHKKVDDAKKKANSAIDKTNETMKKTTQTYLTEKGKGLLSSIVEKVFTIFAGALAGFTIGFLFRTFIAGAAAVFLAAWIVKFLWTGTLDLTRIGLGEHKLFKGVNDAFKSVKSEVSNVADAANKAADSAIDSVENGINSEIDDIGKNIENDVDSTKSKPKK